MRARRRAQRPRLDRLGRRDVLRGMGAACGLLLGPFVPACYVGPEEDGEEIDDGVCTLAESADSVLPRGDWLHGARVAGIAAFASATLCDLRAELDRMADERVSVVEVDSELSSYLDEQGFAEQIRVVDLVARECHARGMRCVAYWPVLESLTPDADKTPHSMAKDHPDWLQIGIDGKPNVFVGGSGRVFWVAPGEESAWLCPTSGYVEYFEERLARLARTAVDGLWGDVPLLSDIVGVWPCLNDSCKARFRHETGLDAPDRVDWEDPRFVRWVSWRHALIWALEQRISAAARRARPDFETIIETVTMDYSGGTAQGLDGAYADDGLVHRVWEVDAVSDATAMRGASEDDWTSMVVMMKHARGCSDPKAAWTFCYGLEEDDAERVMAIAVATGSSPYETKIPEINKSVGSAYRKRMYGWLEGHPEILLSSLASDVAVLYSSASRDIVDRARGVGLYTSTNPGDDLWWTTELDDSAKETEYVADYRGVCKLLLRSHVPFDVMTVAKAGAAALSRYRVVIAPSALGLAADLALRLRSFVDEGGTLVLTGPDAGGADETGAPRSEPLLLRALGLEGPAPGWIAKALGKGRVLRTDVRAGRAFWRTGDPDVARALVDVLPRTIETDAPAGVFFETRAAGAGQLVVACANLEGLGARGVGSYTPRDVTLTCAVEVGERPVARVRVTRPDRGAEDADVPFSVIGSRVHFSLSVHAVAVAIIAFA